MEDATEGTADLILENEEDQTFDVDDDFTVSLDAFQLVELNGIHTNFEIPFNDQTDGGVLIAEYTVTNDLDDDAYYMPTFDISYTGAQKAHSGNRDLLPEEEQIATHLAPDNDYHIEAGESVTGFYAYPFGEDELEDLMDEGTIEIEMPSALSEPEAYDSTIGSNGQMNVDLNEEESGDESENGGDFYEDGATATNMGDKEMVKEAEGIGESEELEDYTVELEGYQFTEFTPNSDEEPRFADFDNGVVLLTVKFNVDNQGSETIGLSPLSSTLTVNDGNQWLTGEGMLLDYSVDDVIESGESGEVLQVYTLDQEQYEKIWKDKEFEVEFGPIRDEDAQDISKGHTAEFVLPE
ncbi:DUF5068 domain-containing protein [Salicibibacter cibi]|uniref:DUF5068 domain-containing protein n=2 Tax=Salicibibacter cibi TaxID=2743001 RepID=A0A7T6ZEH5_9BACI|nr:DUF5068 domain-containing protein [Salicibibacter cibi]